MYAVDLASGQMRWSSRLGGLIGGGVLVSGDTVYAASSPARGQGLRARRANRPPTLADDDRAGRRAARAGRRASLVAETQRGEVLGLDPATGAVRWRRRSACARVPRGRAATAARWSWPPWTRSSACSAARRQGHRRGRVARDRSCRPGSPHRGLLVAGTTDSRVVAIDPADLRPRWRVRVDAPVLGSPAAHGRHALRGQPAGHALPHRPADSAPVAERGRARLAGHRAGHASWTARSSWAAPTGRSARSGRTAARSGGAALAGRSSSARCRSPTACSPSAGTATSTGTADDPRSAALVLALLRHGRRPPAQAQGTGRSIKYGKWVLAAGAVGMNYPRRPRPRPGRGRSFDALEARCFDDHSALRLDDAGRYVERRDRAALPDVAALRPAGAPVALRRRDRAGSARRHCSSRELTRHSPKPDNIPFEPEVRSLRQATGVGLRIGF